MSESTVTMSLREYDVLQKKINDLKNESVRNFIHRDFVDIEKNQYNIIVNNDKIIDFARSNYSDFERIIIRRAKYSFDHRYCDTEVYKKETEYQQ